MRRPIILTAFFVLCIVMYISGIPVSAQPRDAVDLINEYGDFDRWCAREVKESGIIGGKRKLLYEFYGNYETSSFTGIMKHRSATGSPLSDRNGICGVRTMSLQW